MASAKKAVKRRSDRAWTVSSYGSFSQILSFSTSIFPRPPLMSRKQMLHLAALGVPAIPGNDAPPHRNQPPPDRAGNDKVRLLTSPGAEIRRRPWPGGVQGSSVEV